MYVIRKYLDKELFCNVTLSADGKTLKCHQEILSACSNWFERTLSSVEFHQHPIIILKDVNFKELNYLVKVKKNNSFREKYFLFRSSCILARP